MIKKNELKLLRQVEIRFEKLYDCEEALKIERKYNDELLTKLEKARKEIERLKAKGKK